MKIAGRPIGQTQPCFIVAEIGASHGGDKERAHRLVDMAASAGADAVKFQLYRPEDLTRDSDHPAYKLDDGQWSGERLWDLYERAKTPVEWLDGLFERARQSGLVPFASAFSEWAVDKLEDLDCPAYKIASPEVACRDLIDAVALTGKPVIVSDGCSTRDQLLYVKKQIGYGRLCVLNCASSYPADPSDYNVRAAMDYWRQFGAQAGVSDHTTGTTIPIIAASYRASVLEKHIRMTGETAPDDAHALGYHDFRDMVQAVRSAEAATNERDYPTDTTGRPWARRLVFTKDLPAGYLVRPEHVEAVRCGEGLTPPLQRIYATNEAVEAGDPVTTGVVTPANAKKDETA